MERVQFLQHRGQKVLLLDYSNLDDAAEMLTMIECRRAIVAAQPADTVLTLTEVTGAKFPRVVLTKIKEATVFDRPHVRRAALVGVDDSMTAALDAVKAFSARQWKIFPTRDEALDWLVSEAEPEARAS